MLVALLSGILEHYLEYTTRKSWVAYAAQFFAFLAMVLLVIANYLHFTVPEKTMFSLVAAACCFVISLIFFCINLYIKSYRKHKLIKPFLDKIHLFENLLEKTKVPAKGKAHYNYRSLAIWGSIGILILIVRRYLKK